MGFRRSRRGGSRGFVVLLIAYGVKAVGALGNVLMEFRHPIAGNLFGTFLISILLLRL